MSRPRVSASSVERSFARCRRSDIANVAQRRTRGVRDVAGRLDRASHRGGLARRTTRPWRRSLRKQRPRFPWLDAARRDASRPIREPRQRQELQRHQRLRSRRRARRARPADRRRVDRQRAARREKRHRLGRQVEPLLDVRRHPLPARAPRALAPERRRAPRGQRLTDPIELESPKNSRLHGSAPANGAIQHYDDRSDRALASSLNWSPATGD